jgi:putative phage-type endonuclease
VAVRVVDCKQRSPEWYALHQHRLTSGRFKRVLTGTARGWRSLALELRADQTPVDMSHVAPLAWGVKHEPAARAYFELLHPDAKVREVGFVLADDEDYGASPDGLVNRNATLEIKCPYNSNVHLETLKTGLLPEEYRPQVQGTLWVTQRRACWFVSFDPRQPDADRIAVLRIERDEEYIRLLSERCKAFMELYKANKDPDQYFSLLARRLF